MSNVSWLFPRFKTRTTEYNLTGTIHHSKTENVIHLFGQLHAIIRRRKEHRVRQGDPLSPYILMFYAEGLALGMFIITINIIFNCWME